MKAIIFDMDETLYSERDFVESGFKTAAKYLKERFGIDEDKLVSQMFEILSTYGRGKVFDILLKNLGIYSKDTVLILVYLYRSHKPNIKLYDDSISALEQLKKHEFKLGLITDGIASVQRNKITALDLEHYFDVIICTEELGKTFSKPSGVPFKVMLELLQSAAANAIYIGDDVNKDFIGPNSLGIFTVQIKRNSQNNISSEFEKDVAAKYVIRSLLELWPLIKSRNI